MKWHREPLVRFLGIGLEASNTYRINVPANPPTRDFWSIIAYGNESRTFIDSPKFTVSSNDEGVKVNADGSLDLYLSPKPVTGHEANTVIMNPDEDAFLMFRLYGATPELWERKWKLGDPKKIEKDIVADRSAVSTVRSQSDQRLSAPTS